MGFKHYEAAEHESGSWGVRVVSNGNWLLIGISEARARQSAKDSNAAYYADQIREDAVRDADDRQRGGYY